MEMARNPAAMREFMRSQDRQLSNIEVSGAVAWRGAGVTCGCAESAWWVQRAGPDVHGDTGAYDGRSTRVCELCSPDMTCRMTQVFLLSQQLQQQLQNNPFSALFGQQSSNSESPEITLSQK